jgi:phosphopantetheinyl transferase
VRTEIIPCSSLSAVVKASVELLPETSFALVLPRAVAGAGSRDLARQVPLLVLAASTGRTPESMRIEKDARGKPRLVGGGMAFNISHSRGYSLVALSRAGEIGCDIEDRFDNEDVMGLGRSVLHASELEALERLAPQQRQDAFRRYWVRKEAVLKAAGSGFLRDPREVTTGLEARHPEWMGEAGPRFILHNQLIAEGCFAAVASMDATCQWHLLEG